ncbi:hypothetical protein HZF24_06415 [Sedimentibacter hydroxybenzoicus DSM 7310]|uniref:Uncharacterized protein n=1 Tax=Sedimentibacter hydroxybenzoicus DSM 7310 TaxID=1123245 RepID=A0A974BIF9_SEDHY|nr:hypothetical protein [Sedimentibacter hydroxybenzoicus]NYB73773.1 hypothetical protein [Sedimentibacter hydroxybenzoicus DSM 7310]
MIKENSLFFATDFPQEQIFILAVIGESVPNLSYDEVQLTFYTGYQGTGKMIWFDTFIVEDYILEDREDLQEIVENYFEKDETLSMAKRALEER